MLLVTVRCIFLLCVYLDLLRANVYYYGSLLGWKIKNNQSKLNGDFCSLPWSSRCP